MLKNQKGYTAMELILVLGGTCLLGLICGCVWVIYHFVSKAW